MMTMAPPQSESMPKHDEDMGGIREKKIGGQLGLVSIYDANGRLKHMIIHSNIYLIKVSVPIRGL